MTRILAYIFAILLVSPTPLGAMEPKNILLVCSCGEPIAFGAFHEDGAFMTPANEIEKEKLDKLRPLCKTSTPINVWHAERITGKACPLSL